MSSTRYHDDVQFRVWPDGTVQAAEDGPPHNAYDWFRRVRALGMAARVMLYKGASAAHSAVPLPGHPEPRTTEWTALELRAIRRYGDARAAEALAAPTSAFKLNADRSVAVSTEVFWNEDMKDCPRGVKLQLLGAGGVASYGSYTGEPFWVGWAPVPKRRK